MSDFDSSLDIPCGPGMGCPCREAERAAIVKWLREYDSRQPGFHSMRVTRNVANDIERGEHLGGDDE